MKKTFLIVTVLSFSVLLHAQQLLTNDQQEVQQTVINFFGALSNRDSADLKKYCAADIILFENGRIWNADTLILKAITLNTATDFRRNNQIDFISTTVNGTTAWVSYHLRSAITGNGRQSAVYWMETVIAVKGEKSWKIKTLHSTLISRS